MNRRVFLKLASLATASFTFSQWAWAEAQKLMLIDMTGKKRTDKANQTALQMAKGLSYTPDVAKDVKAGKVKFGEKSGVKPEDQFCNKCQFHQMYKEADGVKCTLIQGVLVHDKGGCASWVKKG